MNAVAIMTTALSGIFALAFLFAGTVVLLFLERFVHARVQHRDGPGRAGQVDYWQVLKDLKKVGNKHGGESLQLPLRTRLATWIWRLLPAVFLVVLVVTDLPEAIEEMDLSSLLFLPMIAAAVEALLIQATADSRERFERRRQLLLRVMGATALLLSVMAVTLRVGRLDLQAISQFQEYFPYHSMLSGPGLFICGLTAFCSIFLFTNESPVRGLEDQSLNHSMQYLTVFVQKMWVFSLVCFWVYVFVGGAGGVVAKALFPVKVAAGLFLFTLLQASFPKVRSADAGELTARWLLRLSLLGCLLEALWVGVRG